MPSKNVGRTDNLFRVFKDHETDWTFQRTLQYMNVKAAETAECLYAAKRINEHDIETWIKEWSELAERVKVQGDESLKEGHTVSARESYLRAVNYYRTAEYGTPPEHPCFHQLWEKSVECFHQVCELYEPPIQRLIVEFDGKKLPAYFWRPDDTEMPRPTLVAAGGNDTSLEEVVLICGFDAVSRGYNFFTWEHPGHRGAVHLYPDCVKRGDYEVPYRVAFDLVQSLPGVDERIALTGFSFGGYIAARVATYEPRVRALIPNSPLFDADRATQAFWNTIKRIPDWLLLTIFWLKLRNSPLRIAFSKYSNWAAGTHKIKSLKERLKVTRDWKIPLEDMKNITCPTLGLVSDNEGAELMTQAKEFIETISSKEKRLHIFNVGRDGSDDHCQLDNRMRGNQVMFDWLDDVFHENII